MKQIIKFAMASIYYKKTVECECGVNYGDCGNSNIYILKYINSVDIGKIYVKHHADDIDSKLKIIGTFCDKDLNALKEILSYPDKTEKLTIEELNELNKL